VKTEDDDNLLLDEQSITEVNTYLTSVKLITTGSELLNLFTNQKQENAVETIAMNCEQA
jgi:hypothetical protein